MRKTAKCWIFLALFGLLKADTPIVFPEDDDYFRSSLTGRFALELDDLEYELDNEGDTLVPQILFPRDEEQNFVRLPDQNGEFEIVSRMLVHESRRNGSTFEAAKYVKFRFFARSNN